MSRTIIKITATALTALAAAAGGYVYMHSAPPARAQAVYMHSAQITDAPGVYMHS